MIRSSCQRDSRVSVMTRSASSGGAAANARHASAAMARPATWNRASRRSSERKPSPGNTRNSTLIRAQDFRRIDAYGAVRWDEAGHQRNKDQRGADRAERQEIGCAHAEDERVQDLRRRERGDRAGRDADQRRRHALDEYETKDVSRP